MKKYLTELNGIKFIVSSNKTPPNAIAGIPLPPGLESEQAIWLEAQPSTDEFGNPITIIGVNQAIKDAELQKMSIKSYEDKWNKVRDERDRRLSATDWTQFPDCPLTQMRVDQYKVYRQKLRDVPQANTNPDKIAWPTEPK